MWSLEAFRGHDGRKIKRVEWFGSWLTNTWLSDRPPGNTSPLQSGRMLTLGHKPALSCCSQRLSGVGHRLKHDKIRWSLRMQTFFCSNQSDGFCVACSPVDYWDNIMGDNWEGNYTAKAECLSFWQTWRKQTEGANITRRMSCEASCSLWARIVWRIKCISYKSSRPHMCNMQWGHKNRGCVCVFKPIAMTEEIPEHRVTHQGRQIKVVCSALW